MNVYRELVPPSVVTQCVELNFTGAQDTNLAVVKGNSLLQLFKAVNVKRRVDPNEISDTNVAADIEETIVGEDSFITSEVTAVQKSTEEVSKLVLVDEWPLQGYVNNVNKVRLLGQETDCLVLGFKYAKLVILSWDAASHSMVPISMHYYEKYMSEDTMSSHFFDSEFRTQCIIDPNSDCMCVLYQRDRMAFLPFIQDEDLIEETEAGQNGVGAKLPPIFATSFFVTGPQLEKSVANIVAISFMFEYREPTMAVVFQPERTWVGTQTLHKDTVRYLVVSLDMEHKSSTTITSVQGLPYDIDQMVPLPAPLGGSLLLGYNHLIHIDSSGKTMGVAVNAYSKRITDLVMDDQSALDIRLEGCKIQVVDARASELVMILASGDLYSVKFNMEGRKVLGISIKKALAEENTNAANPSCVCAVGRRHLFVGSKTDDAKFIKWRRGDDELVDGGNSNAQSAPANKNKRKSKAAAELEDDDDDIYGDDEDIYGDEEMDGVQMAAGIRQTTEPVRYELSDRIMAYGPLHSVTVGKSLKDKYALVAASGAGSTGGLCVFERTINPVKVKDIHLAIDCSTIFSFSLHSSHDVFVLSSGDKNSHIFRVNADTQEITDLTVTAKIVRKQRTLGAWAVNHGKAMVQVYENGIAVHDEQLRRIKAIKIDESIVAASCAGQYVLVQLKWGAYHIYKIVADETKKDEDEGVTYDIQKELVPPEFPERIDCGDLMLSSIFGLENVTRKRKHDEEDGIDHSKQYPVGMLAFEGRVFLWNLETGKAKHFSTLGLAASIVESHDHLEPLIANGLEIRRTMLCHLGEEGTDKQEYLVMVTAAEVYLYRPIKFKGTIALKKVCGWTLRQRTSDWDKIPCITPIRIGKYHTVLLSGIRRRKSNLIIKGAKSKPLLHSFGKKSIAPISIKGLVKHGYVCLEGRRSRTANICMLDTKIDYTHQWPVRKVTIGQTVHQVTYHATSGLYAITTSWPIPYNAVDEDGVDIPGVVEELPPASSYQGALKLVSPLTWTVIDEIQYGENEVALTVKSVSLEVSEKTKRRKEFIAVGTTVMRGEDLASKGSFFVYDAIEVVPEPGRIETDHKFKELASESVKGQVSTLCEVSGHLLVSQGQKLVVRNIQEDNSIIPVAFLDMNMYILEAKSIKNLLLLGDAVRSMWFVGFGTEPYRMTTLSKDLREVPLLCGDFMVSKENLFMVVADANRHLHLLQYDPEDPVSLSGQRLLRRSEIFTGREFESMVSIPMTLNENDTADSKIIPIGVAKDGTIMTVVPISEPAYRILHVIQQQIIDKDWHNACLNPRMHRNLGIDLSATSVSESRLVIDWDIVSRYSSLSLEKKMQFSRKLGKRGNEDVQYCLDALETVPDYF